MGNNDKLNKLTEIVNNLVEIRFNTLKEDLLKGKIEIKKERKKRRTKMEMKAERAGKTTEDKTFVESVESAESKSDKDVKPKKRWIDEWL